jgi:hypothetical protein
MIQSKRTFLKMKIFLQLFQSNFIHINEFDWDPIVNSKLIIWNHFIFQISIAWNSLLNSKFLILYHCIKTKSKVAQAE